MEAIKYLEQVKNIDVLIENKLIEKQQWKSIAMCTSSSADGERVQSSSDQQKMANAVHKIIEIEKEIDKLVHKLVNTKQEVISTIESLDIMHYDLLHKIYIQGKELYEISEINGKAVSYSSVKRRHGKALKQVQAILDRREQGDKGYEIIEEDNEVKVILKYDKR